MKLIAIGFLGEQKVYIGLTKEEAVAKWDAESPDYTVAGQRLRVKELDVSDYFYVYDIWE